MTSGMEGATLARQLAHTWLDSSRRSYEAAGSHMLEKLDSESPGRAGGGGEYLVQTGFGWSNGVVLDLLNKYGWPQQG